MICKCRKCQHEWQQVGFPIRHCAQCGASGKKIGDDYVDRKKTSALINALVKKMTDPCRSFND